MRQRAMNFLKRMSKLMLHIVLTVGLSAATTLTAIQLYMDALLEQLHLPQSMAPIKPQDWVGAWGNRIVSMATGKPAPINSQQAGSRAGGTSEPGARSADAGEARSVPTSSVPSDQGQKTTSPEPTDNPASKKPPQDAVAVWSQTSSMDGLKKQDEAELDKRVVMTGEQFAKKKDAMSSEDKLKLFSLLASLPQTELQAISKIAEDGITESELKELQKIVSSYLSPDDYDQVMSIVNKY